MILFLIATILMTFKHVLAFIHIVILIGHSKPCVGINPMTLFLANSSTSVGFQQHHDWLPSHIVCFLKTSCLLFEPKCSSVKPLKRQVLARFHQFFAPKNPVNPCEFHIFVAGSSHALSSFHRWNPWYIPLSLGGKICRIAGPKSTKKPSISGPKQRWTQTYGSPGCFVHHLLPLLPLLPGWPPDTWWRWSGFSARDHGMPEFCETARCGENQGYHQY